MTGSDLPNRIFELTLQPASRLIVAAVAAAYLATGILFIRIDSPSMDFWQHLAAFQTLSINPVHPQPLFFAEAYDVHLYTPYHVFWGSLMSVAGFDVWIAAALSAFTNIALFFIGCRLVAQYLIGEPRLDVVVGLTLFFMWGSPIWWSGVYSFGQIILQAVYPSFFALSVTLICVSLYGEEGFWSPVWLLGFVLAIAVVFLSHPITASVLLILLAAKTITRRPLKISEIAITAAVSLCALSLGLLWPYYSILNLMMAARNEVDFFGRFDVFYKRPIGQIGPALLGVTGIFFLKKSSRIRFLTVALIILTTIFLVNYYTHLSHIFSRYLLYIALLLQLLFVATLIPARQTRAAGSLIIAFFAVLTLAGIFQFYVSARNLHGAFQDIVSREPLGTHSAAQAFIDLTTFGRTLTNKDFLAASPRDIAYPVAALTGLHLLSVRHRAPTMPDFEERADDADRLFDPSEPCAAKKRIVDRRHIDFIIAEQGKPAAKSVAQCGWEVVLSGSRFIVWRPSRPKQAAYRHHSTRMKT